MFSVGKGDTLEWRAAALQILVESLLLLHSDGWYSVGCAKECTDLADSFEGIQPFSG